MKLELRRILIWVKGSNMTQEIATYKADKTSKNYRVYSDDTANRLLPHDIIMKPNGLLEFNSFFLNIWCFNDQLSEASEILTAYGIKRLEEQRKLCIRQIENIENFKETLDTKQTKI